MCGGVNLINLCFTTLLTTVVIFGGITVVSDIDVFNVKCGNIYELALFNFMLDFLMLVYVLLEKINVRLMEIKKLDKILNTGIALSVVWTFLTAITLIGNSSCVLNYMYYHATLSYYFAWLVLSRCTIVWIFINY